MRNFVYAVVLLAGLALAPACEDDPAQPATDSSDVGTGEIPSVFRVMAVALESRKYANYELAISESFVFSPTLEDSLDQAFAGTNVYDNWNKTVEMDVLGLLLADAQSINVEFAPRS